MARGLNPRVTCVSRRSVLKSGAACVALVALSGSEGCGTPGPLGDGVPEADGTADAGGGGGAGAGGNGGLADAGTVDVRGDGGAGGGGGSQAPCSGAVVAGMASSVSLGSLVMVANGLVIGRDTAGLYAMSAICTHQGCGMSVVGAASQESLFCACHGSAFSSNGVVTRGPARRPLQHYQLDVAANGELTVCVGASVASTTRTPG
jgi:Rieske Fe-S protein